jgi:hypothetical protein
MLARPKDTTLPNLRMKPAWLLIAGLTSASLRNNIIYYRHINPSTADILPISTPETRFFRITVGEIAAKQHPSHAKITALTQYQTNRYNINRTGRVISLYSYL